MESDPTKAIVIGAGMGGLASAIRLAAAGFAVTVLERAATPGGKARALPSEAGPVDAGPTVLTLRHVFDELFALNGERLDDHVTLIAQTVLARHWWPDGSTLDLTPDRMANADAIRALSGPREAAAFLRFDSLAKDLYDTFQGPVMRAPRPEARAVARAALRVPRLWPALLPGLSLDRLLRLHFRDPRLIQLFGRYATYVGGRPAHSPAVLALIWQAEARGVWGVQGGMHRLAAALADLAARMGVTFHYDTGAHRLIRQNGRLTAVQTTKGQAIPCAFCVFNGDPAALSAGLMGNAFTGPDPAPPSLSAQVWAFAATPAGPRARDLVHHNLFFTADPATEFGPIGRGRMPEAQTLYLCAEDRLSGFVGTGPERFEIILNAPAALAQSTKDHDLCRTRTFQQLQAMGLTFEPLPATTSLTTPKDFDRLFPGSKGALYGRTPEGAMATFQRPTARTALAGLYLAGGGTHPGAGVPMAALSGKHAVAAILQDRTSPSTSRPTATPGGMSMASRMTGRARSRS
ncbi:1-hydroxycarotenoid 3,4-desaturase CrtD [Paragemmobacter straminiformis]|uniref:Phytoene desaturase n=1 Tax=Paragemmobacter straminiformis TaxID=2045119 RepID=A0A842IBZ6_9RHOB|nr:1-hydroxycarotenoid 3,4-desaturase CrtD [Gemmobacter straminiformis]MBC2836634.1 phytoene desaturase [Gemmobacter straminiformis]